MMRRTVAFSVMLILLAGPSAVMSQPSDPKPVVAVFDLRVEGVKVSPNKRSTLSGYLSSRLTAGGVYLVAPASSIREALIEQKKESHKDCYDQFCQIKIGQAIAANMTLSSLIWRVGNKCSLNLDLYDVRTEAMVNSVEVPGLTCDEAGLKEGIGRGAAKLSGHEWTDAPMDAGAPGGVAQSVVIAPTASSPILPASPVVNAGGGIQWVRLPGGTFQMDSNSVTLSAFEIATTEVTVAQYRKCVDAGACTAPDSSSSYCNWGRTDRDNHPVNCVDWNQASAYAKWVGGRLPTEAEWEYAARSGGRNQEYPWGDQNPSCRYAVMDDELTRDTAGTETDGCGRDSTWPVCSKPAGNTAQGLCDMAGNVWEWISDWYGDYPSGPLTNPTGPSTGSYRVNRGGSWCNAADGVRSANRDFGAPDGRLNLLGFRPARSVR